MGSILELLPHPELVIGLVAPIGVNLDRVTSALSKALDDMKYQAHEFRITKLMQEIRLDMKIVEKPFVRSYTDRIAYANAVRREFGNEALAALAITAIRGFRNERNQGRSEVGTHDPLQRQAYIIRQFKRPEEVTLLRRVYGRQFVLISAYAPPTVRKRSITQREQQTSRSRISKVQAENSANELVEQDSKESSDEHGQNVRDAFPLADVTVDATSEEVCRSAITRFIHLLFGSNQITPTREEYAMYIAKSASLRTADLSRQVGAAIFAPSGEVISIGSNEVPKAGGGTYWEGDKNDARDFRKGYDPNDQRQLEILVDMIERLSVGEHLSTDLDGVDAEEAASKLLRCTDDHSVANSMLMDLLEFGRMVHAEMCALTDAARKGLTVKDAILYCTTFPCHMCAKHIVASGIARVVYIEPYQKSYAHELHADAISLDGPEDEKVVFQTFLGVSPYRYRDLFERRSKRKDKGGKFREWYEGSPRPNIELYDPGYSLAEARVAAAFSNQLEAFHTAEAERKARSPSEKQRRRGKILNGTMGNGGSRSHAGSLT